MFWKEETLLIKFDFISIYEIFRQTPSKNVYLFFSPISLYTIFRTYIEKITDEGLLSLTTVPESGCEDELNLAPLRKKIIFNVSSIILHFLLIVLDVVTRVSEQLLRIAFQDIKKIEKQLKIR